MLHRLGIALGVWLLVSTAGSAQVVRFETNVGEFDMVLNPTNNSRLQGHVDNLLRYVEENRYDGSWINRADEGFVLQMGGFYTHTKRPPKTIESTRPIFAFDPIQGEPAATFTGLSNTIGTVAMALPAGNPDGGTSSFFVNLADTNTFLDDEFTVFAAISDMTVVNEIMALSQIDRTTDPEFGAGGGNLGFSDVPIADNGHQVFILRAFVINDAMSVARANFGVQSAIANSAASFAAGSSAALNSAIGSSEVGSSAAAIGVPEPSTWMLAIVGSSTLIALRRRAAR